MTNTQMNTLISPGFIAALILLLLNDHFFKSFSPNLITGKLSDFAGLFIFPLFWTALFPKSKLKIYALAALCFVFWKSPYSNLFISTWNELAPITVGRTIDYTDLVALSVLPISYVYEKHASLVSQVSTKRIAICLVFAVSLIAFTATSYRREEGYSNIYTFEGKKADLIKMIERLHSIEYFGRSLSPENEQDTFEISFDSCTDTAIINIKAEKDKSTVSLEKIIWRCPNGEREEMLQFFEKEFVDRLRDEEPKPSSKIRLILLSASN
jgi:hypothetical protein